MVYRSRMVREESGGVAVTATFPPQFGAHIFSRFLKFFFGKKKTLIFIQLLLQKGGKKIERERERHVMVPLPFVDSSYV